MPAVLCQHAAVPFVWPVALLGTDPTSKIIVREDAPKLQALAKLQDECILSDVTITGKDDCRIKGLARQATRLLFSWTQVQFPCMQL